ncbi:MAG: DNA recombination protein RmuC [Paramuribaculum sp.]|nr:DNA recombination protein RmuC [Paramuribaculum sp.]
MTTILFAVAIAAVAAIALIYSNSLRSQNTMLTRELDELRRQQSQEEKQLRQLSEENARLTERVAMRDSQIAELHRAAEHAAESRAEEEKKQAERFRLLAMEIFTDHTDRFKTQSENRLAELLTPLRNDIEKFKKSVDEAYSTEARERFSLQERIRELIETNKSIGREAKELTTALRGNSKTQGDWGEMILESILEKSGLRKGEEFTVQQTSQEGKTLRNEEGRLLRPDVVVNYPDGRVVIIDSKVSLTAFVDYINADSPDEQTNAGRRHVESVRKHVAELASKSYQDYVGHERTDFVMMFIPNESAYIAAMTLDNTLWQEAYDKRVLIVSPTHLVSALRLIAMLWSHDRQTRNAIDIAEQSGRMYDKFVAFTEDMRKIEKGIDSLRGTYDSAMTKLSQGTGNLLTRAERLRELGAKAKKSLQQ